VPIGGVEQTGSGPSKTYGWVVTLRSWDNRSRIRQEKKEDERGRTHLYCSRVGCFPLSCELDRTVFILSVRKIAEDVLLQRIWCNPRHHRQGGHQCRSNLKKPLKIKSDIVLAQAIQPYSE
jgi:hypothetical protein